MKQETDRAITGILIGLTGLWCLLIGGFMGTGIYDVEWGTFPLAMMFSVTLPPILFLLAYVLNSRLRSYVQRFDIRPLVLIHSFRVLGIGFLFLYAHDVLPGFFAWPAGLGDVVAAVWGYGLGLAMFYGTVSRRHVLAWNTFGLLDFVVAVASGVMGRSSMEILQGPVFSDPMGSFPLVFVPAFVVPFFVITHLMIYLNRANPV